MKNRRFPLDARNKNRTRKHGDKESFPFPVWSGILDHHEQMGSAVWEFLWCLDKITEETAEGIGKVFGGAPVKILKIATDLKENENTARDNLQRLEKGTYIVRTRTPYGFTIGVINSWKFRIWGPRHGETDREKTPDHYQDSGERSGVFRGGAGRKLPDRSGIFSRNKEDHATDHAERRSRRGQNLAAACDSESPETKRPRNSANPDAIGVAFAKFGLPPFALGYPEFINAVVEASSTITTGKTQELIEAAESVIQALWVLKRKCPGDWYSFKHSVETMLRNERKHHEQQPLERSLMRTF